MKNIKPNLSVEVKNFPEVLASLKWLKEHQIIDAEFEKYA
jgi:hypothetical protein